MARLLPPATAAVLLLLVAPVPAPATEVPDWENPQVLGIAKLDPHAPVSSFDRSEPRQRAIARALIADALENGSGIISSTTGPRRSSAGAITR